MLWSTIWWYSKRISSKRSLVPIIAKICTRLAPAYFSSLKNWKWSWNWNWRNIIRRITFGCKGNEVYFRRVTCGHFRRFFEWVFSEISKAYPIKPDEFESDAQLNRLSWTDLFVIGQAFQEQNAYDFCSLWLGKFMTSFDVRNHFF